MTVTAVHDGASGLGAALEGNFGLVILDVMLPVLDGFAVLRQLRRQSNVPVIMLTARASRARPHRWPRRGRRRLSGQALRGRRAPGQNPRRSASNACSEPDLAPSVVQVGDLRVDAPNRAVAFRGAPIELTPTEFTILEVLLRSAGRIVSRDELTGVLYQRQTTPYERSLDVHVSHLRRKLEGVGWTAIRTVRGQGYICVTDA